MALYKLVKDPIDNTEVVVRKDLGGGSYIEIPLNATGNADWIEYKAWVDSGNTAEAAD